MVDLNQTPTNPLDDTHDDPLPDPVVDDNGLQDDHQATDSHIDAHEAYDEGLSSAAEAEEPPDDAVTSYQPPGDKPKDTNQ